MEVIQFYMFNNCLCEVSWTIKPGCHRHSWLTHKEMHWRCSASAVAKKNDVWRSSMHPVAAFDIMPQLPIMRLCTLTPRQHSELDDSMSNSGSCYINCNRPHNCCTTSPAFKAELCSDLTWMQPLVQCMPRLCHIRRPSLLLFVCKCVHLITKPNWNQWMIWDHSVRVFFVDSRWQPGPCLFLFFWRMEQFE